MQRALNSAALTLPDVDALAPRMLGIDEHRYRSMRLRDAVVVTFQNARTRH